MAARRFFGAARAARAQYAASASALICNLSNQATQPSPPSRHHAEAASIPTVPVAVERALEAVDRLAELLRARPWLTLDDLCAYLAISRSSYYRMKRAGVWAIPEMHPRICGGPRFHVDDLAQFVRAQAAVHAHERLSVVPVRHRGRA